MKRRILTLTALLSLAALTAHAGAPTTGEVASRTAPGDGETETKRGAFAGDRLMYTTYFYTAGEAIVHGYEEETNVRIVSLAKGRTIWTGTVGPGQTKNVPTGHGVFSFLSDKKASLLVGTPSSCTAVGYWLRDRDGGFLSNHFYTELPSSISNQDARVLVWAWEDTSFTITNKTTGETIADGKLEAGKFHELTSDKLGAMNSNVLEFKADKKAINVQVYYDQGYFVPGRDGRLAGKTFRTYVGAITEGSNDLNLINQSGLDTEAAIVDIKTGETIWSGEVPAGQIVTKRLSKRYVKVNAASEISVSVAPKDFQSYAEHHFAAGVEGTGIETKFINTTSQELWVFSYFDDNEVRVRDLSTGEEIWKGTLAAGNAQGVHPGAGNYEITSTSGVSVMGGSAACGAEYSPAGGMFRVDEELLKVAKIILKERKQKARAEGRELTDEEAAAPLNADERRRARDYVKKNANKSMSGAEVQQRLDDMVTY